MNNANRDTTPGEPMGTGGVRGKPNSQTPLSERAARFSCYAALVLFAFGRVATLTPFLGGVYLLVDGAAFGAGVLGIVGGIRHRAAGTVRTAALGVLLSGLPPWLQAWHFLVGAPAPRRVETGVETDRGALGGYLPMGPEKVTSTKSRTLRWVLPSDPEAGRACGQAWVWHWERLWNGSSIRSRATTRGQGEKSRRISQLVPLNARWRGSCLPGFSTAPGNCAHWRLGRKR